MSSLHDQITKALAQYERDDNLGTLLDSIRALSARSDIDALIEAADPFRDRVEVVIPVYENVIARRPTDARSLVALANAYWLSGRGPEIVGELAERARAADPTNRAAWHLWALAESKIRDRVERWTQVVERFPEDQLARAALGDNAAGLAGAEHDPIALEQTLEKLRTWKL